ncbi:MAG: PilT/PilU family type 4a pilus ATPase [Minicystis sp.]
MIVLKTLLSQLGRPEVSEVVLQAGKMPTLRVDGEVEEAGDHPVSGDDLVQLLFSTGGSRYVESLSAKPTQWRTRIDGVGAVNVSATQRGDVIEARFSLRDAPPAPAPTPTKARSPSVPPKGPKTGRPPRGDAAPGSSRGGPPSRKKHASRAPEPIQETPRAPAADGRAPAADGRAAARAAFASSLEQAAPRREGTDTPPPPPVRYRGELPTLPSDMEIDLDLAGEIPSVPQPAIFKEELAAGPISPRTLPEARFSRDSAPPEARARPPAVAMFSAPPAPPQAIPPPPPEARAPRQTAPRVPPDPPATPAPSIHANVAELTEPFAMSVRRPEAHTPPEARARTQSGRTTRPFAREPHTPVFRKLLRAARDAGASDLHLIAGRPPILRVAGQVVPKGEPLEPGVVEDMMLSRVPARLAAVLDRDGSCDFALEEPELGRFRVNVSRQRTGIKASMRLIAPEIPTLAGLGLPDAIAAATRHHQGLIVLTGPTGHGKTTTLAAVVDIINRETTRHIITVEDPIEYLHPRRKAMMSQREVGTHTRSFASALKGSLREDPDVIVVGELRDTETVRMAIAASETGHLVIGTMNTPSAAKTIDRLIDLFPPADQPQVRMTLAGGLRLVVSQRLLPDVDGRRMVAAAEVLPGMVPLWNLIRDGRTYQIPSLQQRGKGYGVIRLDDSLMDLVRAGRTTAAAAIAVAEAPDELENALGIRRPSQTMNAVGRGTSPVRPSDPLAAVPPVPPGPPGGGRQTDPRPQDPNKGGFFERAGALFGGGKKGT